MSAPGASSSSPLVSYSQDVNYTQTEGFKQFKVKYNVKNTRSARNDPNTAYPSAEVIYQAMKGPGCTLRSLDSLLLSRRWYILHYHRSTLLLPLGERLLLMVVEWERGAK